MIDEAIYEITKYKLKNYEKYKNVKVSYNELFNIIIKTLRLIDERY